jgi:magnesium transporter
MPVIVIPDLDPLDPLWIVDGDGQDGDPNLGEWSSLIGIVTAIVGNVLIALALNVQRYSHIQLHRRKVEARQRAKEALRRAQDGPRNGYGTTEHTTGGAHISSGAESSDEDGEVPDTRPLAHSFRSAASTLTEANEEGHVSSSYLKSPSWWLGQILMTIGEMGNFLAYGFAPASIVSPLGVVALISNCVIAPLFFGEKFRARDFWGVMIAVAGAGVVVLSAKQEETKLDPQGVWDAITSLTFEIYMTISVILIGVLMWASPKYGNRTILIDLGLVGLFGKSSSSVWDYKTGMSSDLPLGAYTALSTKGVSSMLSSTLWRAFTTPVTYILILVLLGTAVMQVRYVNKALQRFDSTQVIPIQFVMFTLSVIIGSAVLYRDFERTTSKQAMKFIGGCLLTFFGVFLITSGRPRHDDEECLSDDENIEETINLRHQDTNNVAAAKPGHGRPQTGSGKTSRRSSRVSFAVRPSTVHRDSGVPSPRRLDASNSRASLPKGSPEAEAPPFLDIPWESLSPHHGIGPTYSDDSVVTIHSVITTNTDPLPTDTSLPAHIPSPPSPPPLPQLTTPRASFSTPRPHSHHLSLSNTIISPSPLSSTVSAVVGDALLGTEDGGLTRRRSMRRLRHTIRSSLFVPHSDDEDDGDGLESQPLLYADDEDDGVDTLPPGPPGSADGSASFRGRARSLSNTITGFLGRRRGRRNTGPELRTSQASGDLGDTDRTDAPP